MKLTLLANIITCAGALVGFVYGAFRFFHPKAAVYTQMVTFACLVILFGRLYQIIRIVTVGELAERFHLGVLGMIGSILFLFAANFGVMDSLVDDGSKELRKYRLIPLAAPALVLAAWLAIFCFADDSIPTKIVTGVISVCVMLASYFNLKHLIIPDVAFGVIRSIRQYNLLALIYEFLCFAEMIAQIRNREIITLIVGILAGILLPFIILSVDRGGKKWSV